jgi:hypothetical protein
MLFIASYHIIILRSYCILQKRRNELKPQIYIEILALHVIYLTYLWVAGRTLKRSLQKQGEKEKAGFNGLRTQGSM